MVRRVGLLLFAAGWGANHFGTMLIVYRTQLGLSPSKLALLFGIYALGLVPGLIVAGRTSDRRGRRALVLPASIAAALASVFLAFGTYGFEVLLLGRLFYGLAMGAIMSPGSVWVQELSTDALGPRRATFALSAGFGLGPLLTGLFIELAPAPLVLPYVAHAATTVVAVILARPVPETASMKKAAGTTAAPGESAYRLLLAQLPVAPWAFAFPAVCIAVFPGLMRSRVSHAPVFAGGLIAVTLLIGLLVQPWTTRLGRRGDLVGLFLGSIGLFLGAHAISVFSPYLVFVAGTLLGAGYGLVMTTGLKSIATRVASAQRGTAVGIYYVLTYIGFSLPFIHAAVARKSGDVVTLQWTAGLALSCVVLRAVTSQFESRPSAAAPPR